MKKTAITISIEQDKNRIEMLKEEINILEFNHPKPLGRIEQYNARIYELQAQIQDKIILRDTTEREQIVNAYGAGQNNYREFIADRLNNRLTYDEQYFLNTYGNGE